MEIPQHIETVDALEEFMTRPQDSLIQSIKNLPDDILVLGAGGKMGVTLAILAKRAAQAAQVDKKVIAVSRFSNPEVSKHLEKFGVKTISCDIFDRASLRSLPEVENVVFMVGMKFGSTGNEAETWATNAYVPGIVSEKFRNSKIVLFSTGSLYPLVPTNSSGCKETDLPGPIGEYSQSVLGRERIFQYFSKKYGIKGVIYRLNYAIDLRYGVLVDIAQKVYNQEPVDVTMGYANIIWQGDANTIALRSFELCENPPFILNVTGTEKISTRQVAEQFGKIFGKPALIKGSESETAFLSDASLSSKLFGEPSTTLDQMIRWTAHWIKNEGQTLGKPTKFEVRVGKY